MLVWITDIEAKYRENKNNKKIQRKIRVALSHLQTNYQKT